MRFNLECQYCGKKWEESFFYRDSVKEIKCKTCGDKNIKVKEYKPDDTDPFGYNHQEKKRVSKTQ